MKLNYIIPKDKMNNRGHKTLENSILKAARISNIFPAARKAVEPWDEFPWHQAEKIHSSQALAIDVFGTIQTSPNRDFILDNLAENIGAPSGGSWNVKLEWKDPKNLIQEHSRTQVDVVAFNEKCIIFFECKFTERSGGKCSQTQPLKQGPKKGLIQCNGKYMEQTNPVNNKKDKCALTGKNIRYWEVIPDLFTDDIFTDDTCLFSGSWFQWMRNLTVCHEVAKDRGLKPFFVLAYADATHFSIAREIRTGQWKKFTNHIKLDKISVKTQSFQEIVRRVNGLSLSDKETFQDLEKWVTCKITLASLQNQNVVSGKVFGNFED